MFACIECSECGSYVEIEVDVASEDGCIVAIDNEYTCICGKVYYLKVESTIVAIEKED